MNRLSPYIIGIAGGSGSGKTFIIEKIAKRFHPKDIVRIQHDWYYRHNSHLPLQKRASVNYDHPRALETSLLVTHLTHLLAGRPVHAPKYDFNTHLRKQETLYLESAPMIVIDGILIFTDDTLRQLMDLKIYVDVDPDIRLARRMQRDIKERGRTRESILAQYLETVKPMHEKFVAPSRQHADIIIRNNDFNESDLINLVKNIQKQTGLSIAT